MNIDGDSRQVYWNGNGHNGIGGTMILSSSSAQNEVEFQNPIDLYGGAEELFRLIRIRTPAATSQRFCASGATRSAAQCLTKTGLGTLYIRGPAASNTYTGLTTIANGSVVLAKTGGAIAIAGNILLSEPGDGNSTYLVLNGNNRNRLHERHNLQHPGGLFAPGIAGVLTDGGRPRQRSLVLRRSRRG